MPTDLQKKDELRKDYALLEDILEALVIDNVESPRTIRLVSRRMEQIKLALED